MANLNTLPQELLNQIFSHLAPKWIQRASRIYWYRACYAINHRLLDTATKAFYEKSLLQILTDGTTVEFPVPSRCPLRKNRSKEPADLAVESQVLSNIRKVHIFMAYGDWEAVSSEEFARGLESLFIRLLKVTQLDIDVYLVPSTQMIGIPVEIEKMLKEFVERSERVVTTTMTVMKYKEPMPEIGRGGWRMVERVAGVQHGDGQGLETGRRNGVKVAWSTAGKGYVVRRRE